MGMVGSKLYWYCGVVCVESEVAIRETKKTIGCVRYRLCQTYVSQTLSLTSFTPHQHLKYTEVVGSGVIHFTKVFFSKVLEGVSKQVDACHDSSCLWYLTQSCLQPLFIVPVSALFLVLLKRVAKRNVDGWGKHLIPWGVYSDTQALTNEEEDVDNELEPLASKTQEETKENLFFGIKISWKRFWTQVLVWAYITLIASLLAGLLIFLPLHTYLIKAARAMMEDLRCRPNHLEVVMVTLAFPLCIDITQYLVVDYIIQYKIRPSSPNVGSVVESNNH